MLEQYPFYDPARTYKDNFEQGPFGEFPIAEPYQDAGEPAFTFLGHAVNSPFGIPAGPLLNANYVTAALESGFDVVTYKTQRTTQFEVNPFPNVVYVDVEGDL